jgi:hypothetical protein
VDTSRMNTGTYSLALNVQNVSRIYKFVKNWQINLENSNN